MSRFRSTSASAVFAIVLLSRPALAEDGDHSAAAKAAEQFASGSQILLKSLQAWNDSTAPLVREGDRRARIGDYKGAIDSYTLGLQVEESTRTRYRRAYCLALIKKYELAIEDCTLNLTADPKHYESQAMRAWCQVKAGKFSEATSDYETLIAAQPNDARHAYALGSLQVYAKDYSKATEWYSKAIRNDPKDIDSYLACCRCLLELKQNDQAVEQIAKLLKQIPAQAGGYRRSLSFERELSAEDLKHGSEQVEAMLKDRPEMAAGMTPDNIIYQWAVRKFAGEDIPEKILWNNTQPEGSDADHGAPHGGKPGRIRVAYRKRGLFGLVPGRKQSFDELWSKVCYEFHNIQGTPGFEFGEQLASRGELSRDGYIRQMAYNEYLALLRTRAFYVDVYFPWARERKIETDPEQWRIFIPSSFEDWFEQYDDRAQYPWEPYGRYYDSIQKHNKQIEQAESARK